VKLLAALALAGGMVLAAVLVLTHGVGAIWHSSARVGWLGFGAIVAIHLGLVGLMGAAWWLLEPARRLSRLGRFGWGRLIRDSTAETLPLSPIGGYVFGARALALSGVSGSFAAASTVVDVTVELVAQLAYTLLGLWLLDQAKPDNSFGRPVLAGVAAMSVLVVIFVTVQARGAGSIERFGARLARQFLGRKLGGAGAVQAQLHALHRGKEALGLAACIHFASWVLAGVETWVTLRLMGAPLSLGAAITVDSLLYGMRSVAFVVPNAVGVQEGGLMLLCGLFGIGPDVALALSLIKRARDVVIGLPALLIWQGWEVGRARAGALAGAAGAAEPVITLPRADGFG
jgi:putative membrane protein